jgi:hypothetical protein
MGAGGADLAAHAQSAFMTGLTHGLGVGALALALGAAFVAVRAPGRAESTANAGIARRTPSEEPQLA